MNLQHVSHEFVDGTVIMTVRYRVLGFLCWRTLVYVRPAGREYWFQQDKPHLYGNTFALTNLFDLAEAQRKHYERIIEVEESRVQKASRVEVSADEVRRLSR